MASALSNPFEASLGAAIGAGTGSLSGAAWLASQFAKFGRTLAGAPGELSAAMIGAGTGAAAGAAVGATIGALSGRLMIQYLASGDLAAASLALANAAGAPFDRLVDLRWPGLGARPAAAGATPPEPPAATVPPAPSPFPGEPPSPAAAPAARGREGRSA